MISTLSVNTREVNVSSKLLPFLEQALSCEIVAKALTHDWSWARNRGLIIDSVELLRMYSRGKNYFAFEYNVNLYGDHGDESQFLLGELFHGDIHKHCEETIQSLLRRNQEYHVEHNSSEEVGVLHDLGMVVRLLRGP